jgi:2-polyprenyl-6-methoxyphenol hydroxylase-like FAD-dependent oxidoreductase
MTPILIIGAGIAGCALGIALRRFGLPSTVCEASAEPQDDIGGFVNIAPNGLRVLHAMNLVGLAHRIGFPTDRLDFHDRDGHFLASVPAAGVTVLRGVLSRVLRTTAEKLGVRFEFGKALDAIRENESDLTAHFSDGTTRSSRVIVGADGVHSRTREIFFPHAPRASYAGILHFGGITRTDLRSTGNMMRMIFGHRAFFGYGVSPSGDTCWFSNCNQATPPSTDIGIRNLDNDAIREKLLSLHRGDPPELSQILRSTTGRVGVYAVYDLPSLPQWHRGGVCLIGDAAHAVGPHIGQGTSLALEDAFVLAKCLKNVPDPIDAFALFGALRRNRVESIFEHSRQLGRQRAPVGWLGGNLPDLILPKILQKKARDAAAIYIYGLQWDKDPVPGLDFSAQPSSRFL